MISVYCWFLNCTDRFVNGSETEHSILAWVVSYTKFLAINISSLLQIFRNIQQENCFFWEHRFFKPCKC